MSDGEGLELEIAENGEADLSELLVLCESYCKSTTELTKEGLTEFFLSKGLTIPPEVIYLVGEFYEQGEIDSQHKDPNFTQFQSDLKTARKNSFGKGFCRGVLVSLGALTVIAGAGAGFFIWNTGKPSQSSIPNTDLPTTTNMVDEGIINNIDPNATCAMLELAANSKIKEVSGLAAQLNLSPETQLQQIFPGQKLEVSNSNPPVSTFLWRGIRKSFGKDTAGNPYARLDQVLGKEPPHTQSLHAIAKTTSDRSGQLTYWVNSVENGTSRNIPENPCIRNFTF
jgi:hypothetical protein